MTTINLNDLQRDLPECLKSLHPGETLLVMQDNRPLAEIKPCVEVPVSKRLRPFGLCAGEFTVPDDFDAPPNEVSPDSKVA